MPEKGAKEDNNIKIKTEIKYLIKRLKQFMKIPRTRKIKKCRLCSNKKFLRIHDFGNHYVSNFVSKNNINKGIRAPLNLIYCNNCKLLSNSDIKIYQCLGHKYITSNTNIILGTEYSINYDHQENWKERLIPIQVCQWFMISKPKQKLFFLHKNCFLTPEKNIVTPIK